MIVLIINVSTFKDGNCAIVYVQNSYIIAWIIYLIIF